MTRMGRATHGIRRRGDKAHGTVARTDVLATGENGKTDFEFQICEMGPERKAENNDTEGDQKMERRPLQKTETFRCTMRS
jgi:hypothetical protein